MSLKEIKIVLDEQPPSTQTIYKVHCRWKFGILYMTKKGKEIKERYSIEIKSQYKGKVLENNIQMEITLFFKDKRRRDIDNYNKLILDSLEGIIYKDDSQIQTLTVHKFIDKENPRVDIKIMGCQK